MAKYKLMIARTQAHLHKYLESYKDYNYTGFSFPYVNEVDKQLADKIVRLLNSEEAKIKSS